MIRCVAFTAAALTLLAGAGAVGFVYSGLYNIAASEPHFAIVRWALSTLQRNAVEREAADIVAPPLDDPALVRRGFVLYEEQCVVCHGAPGVGAALIGQGLNPTPPRMTETAPAWSDGELFWIIKHGIRMAGMPAFETGLDEREIWSLVAYIRRSTHLELAEYAAMLAAAAGRLDPAAVAWTAPAVPDSAQLRDAGDPAVGRRLFLAYGCGSCHFVPGIGRASGMAGPPLGNWAARHYIAGLLLNTPANLVRWITSPQDVEPGTAMPDLAVSDDDAWDIAAFLYQVPQR